jgi:hypothetical protein
MYYLGVKPSALDGNTLKNIFIRALYRKVHIRVLYTVAIIGHKGHWAALLEFVNGKLDECSSNAHPHPPPAHLQTHYAATQ